MYFPIIELLLLVSIAADVVDSAETERERELQEDTGLPHTESNEAPTAPGLAPAPSRDPLPPSVWQDQREGELIMCLGREIAAKSLMFVAMVNNKI